MACSACENTLFSYVARYANDEEASIDLAIRHEVMAKSIKCQKCWNRTKLRKIRGAYMHRCQRQVNRQNCNFLISARANTFFANSKLPISKTMNFILLWLLLRNPGRHSDLINELSVSERTVVDWSSYCREVCVQWMLERRNQIGGPGTIVEIDEPRCGKLKRSMGRSAEGQRVFGGVQRGDNSRFFLVPVEHPKNAATLIAIIRDWILPGTIIISDCWKDYDISQNEGFMDLKVNHSVEFVITGKAGYNQLKKIASMTGQNISELNLSKNEAIEHCLQYSIKAFGTTKTHFEGHFAEYIFKQVHKRQDRMHHFLKAAAALHPPLQ